MPAGARQWEQPESLAIAQPEYAPGMACCVRYS